MDLYLYRLSVSALAASALLIALFFAVLRRSVPLAEMRWWTYGWAANFAALTITLLFWYLQPAARFHGLVFGVYLVAKVAYVWLLLRGALELHAARPKLLATRFVMPAVLVACAAAVFVVTTRDRLGLVTSVVVAIGFGAGTISLLRVREFASAWLAAGFGLRAALAALEGVGYGFNLAAAGLDGQSAFLVPANRMLAAHYSFGTGAEWLIAMGCVIAVSERMRGELRKANAQMLAAQADLRRLADRDPLTALANRRTLPDVFRRVQPQGATLIFFDLNGFKRINDEHGHQAGDDCLVRFAAALTESFRPTDAVIRYAGDEFLVVAPGLDQAVLKPRIEAVRARMRTTAGGALPIAFSCGIGLLTAGGSPDDALRVADEAMYKAKPVLPDRDDPLLPSSTAAWLVR